MTRIKSIVWGSRKRRVAAVVAAFLISTASASAALFILYSGVSGGSSGSFNAANTIGAINITATSAQPSLGPGDVSAPIHFWAENRDSVPHGVSSLTEAFASTPSQCAAFLTLQNKSQLVAAINDGTGGPTVIPPGVNRDLFTDGAVPANNVTITLGAAAPASCANGTWTITFTGVTT